MRKFGIIIDIDGTLADCSHRLHLIRGEDKDWTKFFELAWHDEPIPFVVDMLRSYINDFNLNHRLFSNQELVPIYMSGRPENVRPSTTDWLFNKVFLPKGPVFLRASDDFRQDILVKKELYDIHIKYLYDVLFALDDRERVCKMWQSLGIKTFQISMMPEEFDNGTRS